ncbi:MAG: protein-glutamate methylesterase/protein-glutamine glutaminase [Thermodesulfobacteriota bacterium]
MVKVLVVDDSAFMRRALSTMLDKDPEIEVAGIAKNGEDCLEQIRKLDPDVVTLDIEMPVMDGLTALRRIMMEFPRPVLMVSSLTTEGAEATLKAMELGAVDFIPKQLSKVSLEIVQIQEELRDKVKAIAKRKITSFKYPRKKPKKTPEPQKKPPEKRTQLKDIVGIGVSTGGPPAVQQIVSGLDKDFPACILIAQHMPGAFTSTFAKRLNTVSSLTVKEAETGDQVKNGMVYIAPGGYHIKLHNRENCIDIEVDNKPEDVLYKPSANILLQSIAMTAGRRAVGTILTGMGNDGLEGIRLLKEKKGRVLAQSDSTCIVYGMPRAVVEAGLVDEIVDIQEMAEAIKNNLYQ